MNKRLLFASFGLALAALSIGNAIRVRPSEEDLVVKEYVVASDNLVDAQVRLSGLVHQEKYGYLPQERKTNEAAIYLLSRIEMTSKCYEGWKDKVEEMRRNNNKVQRYVSDSKQEGLSYLAAVLGAVLSYTSLRRREEK